MNKFGVVLASCKWLLIAMLCDLYFYSISTTQKDFVMSMTLVYICVFAVEVLCMQPLVILQMKYFISRWVTTHVPRRVPCVLILILISDPCPPPPSLPPIHVTTEAVSCFSSYSPYRSLNWTQNLSIKTQLHVFI